MSAYDPSTRRSIFEHLKNGPLRVAVIGSGNWGTTVARIIGQNTRSSYVFEDTVRMYVYEEEYQGQKLSTIINETHINSKYLPDIVLPDNLVAVPNIRESVKGAQILVFVMPHQFVKSLCKEMQGHIEPGAKAISLVKGFDCVNNQINLISSYIRSTLGIECSSLSGANVAMDIAKEQFAESTIGYEDIESAQVFQQLFDRPYFRVSAVPDIAGVELCGALKNIVALAAGFVDGLKFGSNTKAAIIRIGLIEIRKFAAMFYRDTISDTFWESAGIADLITTCYGGRNRQCAEAFIVTGKSWAEIEKSLLGGQKLQGTHTCRDVYVFLTAQGKREFFPLFTTVYEICDTGADPKKIITRFMATTPRTISKGQPNDILTAKL